MAQVFFLASVYLFGVSLVLGEDGCIWELKKNQGLDPRSLDAGVSYSAHLSDINEPERCRSACCAREDCQLALFGTAADHGTPECFLVNCWKNGINVCVLAPSSQFEAYNKTQEPKANNLKDDCRFQANKGVCRAAFPRFYYDVTNQTCKQFVYGGCGGNNNNFETQQECETTCGGVTGDVLIDSRYVVKREMAAPEDIKATSQAAPQPEMTSEQFAARCQAEPKVGHCKASMPRYYYKNGECQRFRYGGCGGNENNYVTEEECMKTCTVKIVQAPKVDDLTEYQAFCTVPPYTGLCRGAFRKFYFEPSTQSCQEFIYGGCSGNKNRYDTLEECMSKCSGKDGSIVEHGKARRHDRWAPGFFLVATLVIMSVVLLAGLLLISVRRARRQHIFTLDDKQELLPEEQLTDYVH